MIRTLKIKLLLFCCIVMASMQLNAQGWEKKYSPDFSFLGNEVYPTHDGGYLLTGATYRDQSSAGRQRIMKISATGQVIWKTDQDSINGASWSNITQDGGLITLVCSDAAQAPSYTITKSDSMGHRLWYKPIGNFLRTSTISAEIDTTDSGGFVCAFVAMDTTAKLFVVRLDGNGNIIWQKSYYDTLSTIQNAWNINNSKDGGFVITASTDSGYYGKRIFKIDGNGNFLWDYNPSPVYWASPLILHDGNILLTREQTSGYANLTLVKLSSMGATLWSHPYLALPDTNCLFGDWIEESNHTISCVGHFYNNGPTNKMTLYNLDTLGNVLHNHPILSANLGSPYMFVGGLNKSMHHTMDGGYILGGSTGGTDSTGRNLGVKDPFLIKTDSNGLVYRSTISGYVYRDLNQNCTKEPFESYLTPSFVTLASATDTFTVTTSNAGYYSAGIDTVAYLISVVGPSPYWQSESCNQTSVQLSAGLDSSISFGMAEIAQGPYITINGRLLMERPCLPGIYTAQYCNYGTTPFTGIVQLTVDTLLRVDSSSTPWIIQNGNEYLFLVNNLSPMQCGTIELYVTVSCDTGLLGRTTCIDAQAFQDTIINPSPLWDRSNLRMSAAYNPTTDSITFTLKNNGSGGMGGPKGMIVIEDNVILSTIAVQLVAGAQITQSIKANGATWRATIYQTDYNPYSEFTTAAIEGAGRNSQNSVSRGYFTQYPYNGYTSYQYNTCAVILNSFDPNEKTVSPTGVGTNHLVDTNTTLEYTIYFQNTGNDTAYLVRITDTLSPYVDPATIRQTISSSPCTMELEGRNVVTFTFYPINLPDSGHNQLRSNGFVKYSIHQKHGNAQGTVIDNKADIYFDYNRPITTNTATVRIGQVLISGIEAVYKDKPVIISAYPNPFNTSAVIKVEGENFKDLQLSVYDMSGRLVKQQNIQNNNQFILDKDNLTTGYYTFAITTKGQAVGNGKIVVQ